MTDRSGAVDFIGPGQWSDVPQDDPRLDPRAWLIWALAASLPPLVSRNPLVLLMVLTAVIGVRAAWSPIVPRSGAWGSIVRLTVIFAMVGMLFNILTVHIGESVFFRLPENWPIIGGPLTLNALVYGLLTGLALLTLVLTGTTLGMLLDWPALLRLLPSSLTPLAVAGSVAWAFLPQTAVALREIREARLSRGYRGTGPSALVSLVVPLLAGGLERALMLAEAMEARGFGAAPGETRHRHTRQQVVVALGMASGIVGGYAFAAGDLLLAASALIIAACLVVIAVRGSRASSRPTRFRTSRWSMRETVIIVSSMVAICGTVVTLALDASSLGYDPYPQLQFPHVAVGLLAPLALLVAPAFAVPVGSYTGEEEG
jgi:energy-coupling factor transport system permease protein